MRRALLLVSLLVMGCTVVPEPDATASSSTSHPELVGTWTARGTWMSDTLIQRLALFPDGRYLRAATDSSVAAPDRTVLLEDGLWSFASQDTGKLVLAPSSRLTYPATATALSPAVLVPDTVAWASSGDSLSTTLRRWWARDTFQTVVWHRS
jgi:hypothetical protein